MIYLTSQILASTMNDFGFKNFTQLRGGWFTSPDEYESMGYTIGMPPGYYAPNHPEITKLVEKIKPLGGIIFPSSMKNPQSAASKRRVMAINIPPDMSAEMLGRFVVQQLLKKKLISDPNPIELIEFRPESFDGYITFKSQNTAEAAVSIGKTLIYNGRDIHILWPDNSHFSSDIVSFSIDENQLKDTIYVEFLNQMIDEKAIYELFEPKYQVSKIFIPNGCNYAIVTLTNDTLVFNAVTDIQLSNDKNIIIRPSFLPVSAFPNIQTEMERRQCQLYAGPSQFVSVVNENLIKNACIADVLNIDLPASTIIQSSTEEAQIGTETVLCLYNIAKEYVLMDQELTAEFLTDITEECQKYGRILDCKLEPLPFQSDYGVIKLQYDSPEAAKRAQIHLAGRRYEGRIIVTSVEDQM